MFELLKKIYLLQSMYELLRTIHLIAVSPCLIIGAYLICFSNKGSGNHKKLGWIYMLLMFFQAGVSLFMEARVGPQFLNHFGWIHLLSILTLHTVPKSIYYIKKGDIIGHSRSMIILFFSGLIIAGGFTLFPGRYLHDVFFN